MLANCEFDQRLHELCQTSGILEFSGWHELICLLGRSREFWYRLRIVTHSSLTLSCGTSLACMSVQIKGVLSSHTSFAGTNHFRLPFELLSVSNKDKWLSDLCIPLACTRLEGPRPRTKRCCTCTMACRSHRLAKLAEQGVSSHTLWLWTCVKWCTQARMSSHSSSIETFVNTSKRGIGLQLQKWVAVGCLESAARTTMTTLYEVLACVLPDNQADSLSSVRSCFENDTSHRNFCRIWNFDTCSDQGNWHR